MKTGHYYASVGADSMVDISSGKVVLESNGHSGRNKNNKNKKGKKAKIIVIASVAVAVAAALGVTGFCIFKNNESLDEHKNVVTEFKFPGTVVSGVDITGKNFAEAKSALEASKAKFIKPIKIEVNVQNETIEMTQDDFDYTFDIDGVLEKAKIEAESERQASKNATESKKTYEVTATVTEDSISRKTVNLCETYDKDSIDAYVSKFHPYSDNRFEYVDAVEGYKVDSDNLKEQLIEAFGSGKNYCTIAAQGEATEANVSKEFLQDNIVKLATYKTVSYNSADGTTNMKVALEACNGSIIDPNKIWSFNECTGDSNKTENGYKPAGVISEGQFTTGVGGGICQASSTIYNAALRANMTIEERYCHQFASAYVPTGLDATIDYPRLDLKLQNTSGYQMFLECKVDGTTLYATFWGYQSPDYDVIKTRNELESKGNKTYKVRAWRVYYKDGKQVDEQELFQSEYDYNGGGATFISAEGDTGAVGVDDNITSTQTVTEKPTEAQSYTYQSSQQSYPDSQQSAYEPETPATEAPTVEQAFNEETQAATDAAVEDDTFTEE